MNRIRVLLANYPVMVPDAIQRLVNEQDDMEMVGNCRGPMRILQEVGRVNADAVILAQEGLEEPGICSQLLSVYPDLIILSLTSDMQAIFTQRLRSRRCRIEHPHQQDILKALRLAAHEVSGWIGE